MINFSVSLKPGLPIYEQVVYAVKRAVVAGQLRPGDRFPSVRDLSKELNINPNTAQKIITTLVRERILQMEPGIGSSIAAPQGGTEEQRRTILDTDVEKLVVEARRLGITKADLIAAIESIWKGKRGPEGL
jgi:GntR family transcriptional regulator